MLCECLKSDNKTYVCPFYVSDTLLLLEYFVAYPSMTSSFLEGAIYKCKLNYRDAG